MTGAEIALAIRQARLEHGISQQRLAAITGTTLSMIQKIEYGSRKPSLPMLERICDELGLEIRIEPKKEE